MEDSSKIKISVIIPVYNVELYLGECIESLINQTYGLENLEIILVEDRSTDNSYQIAKSFKEKYSQNIILIQNDINMGLGKNRNIGVKCCSGEYLLFMDSDDKLPLDAIEKFTQALTSDSSIDLVLGKHLNWFGDRFKQSNIYTQSRLFKEQAIINIRELELKELFLLFDLTPAWAKMYRTEFLKHNGLKSVEGHFYEDALLSMQVFFKARKAKFINDVVYHYRRDNLSSITRTFSLKKNDDYLKSIYDVRNKVLVDEFALYKPFSDLRLFNMWRNVIFVNVIELIPPNEVLDYEENIKGWLLVSKDLSTEFIQSLPLFWRQIIEKVLYVVEQDGDIRELILYLKKLKRISPRLIMGGVLNKSEKKYTLPEFLETFENIEKKLDLLNKQIDGSNFWRLIRFAVFENLLIQLKLQRPMGGEMNYGLATITEIIEHHHSVESSPFSGKYNVEAFVFDHSRRQKYKGNYIDYKSYELLKNFDELDYNYQVLESPTNGKHLIPISSKRKYLESLDLFLQEKEISVIEFNLEENFLLLQLEKEIFEQTGVIITIRNLLRRVLIDFKLKYYYFIKLFNKRKTKKVYIVGAWWNTAIIAAAKKLNIEVIDIQYAAFSKYHLGFSYSHPEVPYYPDKIYLWGDYWKTTGNLPIKEDQQLILGNTFIQEKIEEYKHVKRENQILFLSQGVHGEQINFTAYKLAEILPDYQIVVKLHPKEKREVYESKYNGLSNFKYTDDSVDLFYYLAQSQYSISVFSTAIFEAAALGSQVILLNLFGVEHFIDMVENGYFLLANDAKELKQIIVDNKTGFTEFKTDYFFSNKTTLDSI